MVKRINAIEGVMKTLKAITSQDRPFREEALNYKEDNWVVDTVEAFDTHKWETGISTNEEEDWEIVEQYKNKEEAIKGHQKWIKLMQENPKRKLEDINLWDI